MAEGKYTQSINQAVRQHPPAYAWKIHDNYAGGVPDAYYSGNKADLWVEYKWVQAFPKRAPVNPKLSELQRDWLRRHHAHGRNVAVIIASPEGGVIYPGISWDTPQPIDQHTLYKPKGVAEWLVAQVNLETKSS